MTLPEGRKPLLWIDMEFAKPVKAHQLNCLSGHPSTWEQECKARRVLMARVLPLLKQGLDNFWVWQDYGPDGSGWPSDENTACREALEAWCAEAEITLVEYDAERLEIEKLRARVAKLEAVLGKLVLCEDAEFYPGAIESGSPYCIDFDEWHREARAALQEGDT